MCIAGTLLMGFGRRGKKEEMESTGCQYRSSLRGWGMKGGWTDMHYSFRGLCEEALCRYCSGSACISVAYSASTASREPLVSAQRCEALFNSSRPPSRALEPPWCSCWQSCPGWSGYFPSQRCLSPQSVCVCFKSLTTERLTVCVTARVDRSRHACVRVLFDGRLFGHGAGSMVVRLEGAVGVAVRVRRSHCGRSVWVRGLV